jgi:PhnB protein
MRLLYPVSAKPHLENIGVEGCRRAEGNIYGWACECSGIFRDSGKIGASPIVMMQTLIARPMNAPNTLSGNIEAYLFFDGRCEEAIEFYKKAVGARVNMMMRFKESPEPPQPGMQPPGSENKIMHADLSIGSSTLLVSDGRCQGKPNFDGFALTISLTSEAEADRAFTALADGGKVEMPLTKTFFSPRFGMLEDRFGVTWMILVRPPSR